MNSEEDALAKENSAVKVAVFAATQASQLHPAHVNELLSIAAWMFTEARGKYTTRYITRGAISEGVNLRHEHVVTRLELRTAILKHPERAEQLLRLAVPCTVTKKEHALLKPTLFGWRRYIDAELKVVERDNPDLIVDIEALADELEERWKQLAD
jgi:hypothetical protein